MYAVIETGGKQYKVEPGQVIEIELLEAQGGKVTFDRVLLASDGKDIKVGAPTIPNATVKGELLGVEKSEKTLAFKKHKRKDWKWARGHRQSFARVRIDEIALA